MKERKNTDSIIVTGCCQLCDWRW